MGETRFSRSLIRSERRLTYGEVNVALGGGSLGDAALEGDVAELAALSRLLRERRMDRGALEAASAEPVVVFDEDRVADVRLEGQTPAHSLVEECMIAANEAVARHLIARNRPTVFRHHEDPAQSRVEMLYAQLDELGVADAAAARRGARPRRPPRRRLRGRRGRRPPPARGRSRR